jgi:DMSO/TMAO reductase YedYZ molybdopterin-dependent catalytic subunit
MVAGAAPWLQACAGDPAAADFGGTTGPAVAPGQTPIANVQPKVVTTTEKLNSFEDITSYNNFFEFGTGKSDPQQYAGKLTTSPWKVKIDGHCSKPADYQLEDLIKPHQLEERIYRLRCVEGWSMVIPWVGIPLASVLKAVEPTSKATFVKFTTLQRPAEMIGQNDRSSLAWPYTEGLRLDEAMHPLTILSVGLYGKTLMNQNGAPIRLVVPWKYGFKSIKSIVRVEPAVAGRVRLLFQRESAGGSSALEPEHRAANPRIFQEPSDGDVQRLRRPSGVHVCRHGPSEVLLERGQWCRRPEGGRGDAHRHDVKAAEGPGVHCGAPSSRIPRVRDRL